MEEAISTPTENSSFEYYKYLSERVKNSPLSLSANPFFPELTPTKEEGEKQ